MIIGVTPEGEKECVAIGDGAMGFWAVMEEVFSPTKHQRCWLHKMW